MAEPLLRAEHLGISFRGLRALDDVNFSIPQGAVMGLIGPNGAGKTTLFNLLTGVYTPTDGTVTLDGEVISGKGMFDLVDLNLYLIGYCLGCILYERLLRDGINA